MARNGSGLYSRVAGPYVYNTIIDQVDVNAELDDISTALTNSLTKNGETTATANQPMGTFRHTGVGNGVSRTDYPSMGQVQDGTLNWVDGGGTANAITAAYSPAITALVDGQICCVRATGANTITNPTFSPNGLTARVIYKLGGQALEVGSIRADQHELNLRYDLNNTRWELLNPAFAAIGGSASQAFAASTFNATTGTFSGTLTPQALLDVSGASAGQIKFPATQNASSNANTLDDYEEGPWTPTLTFGGASVGMTYTTQVGTYTKIGRVIVATFDIWLSAAGSSTGNAQISGLLFALPSTFGETAIGWNSTNTGLVHASVLRYSDSTLWVLGIAAASVTSSVVLTHSTLANNALRLTGTLTYNID